MKEYLFKHIDGRYHVVDRDCNGKAVEIPDGADIYLDNSCFYKLGDPSKVYLNDQWEDVAEGYYTVSDFVDSGDIVLWQRHTQPEELPFLDDGDDDKVNHPSHYASGAIECIDAIESSMTKEAFAGYLKGNVQKYMWRYENKGGVESLQKSQWYLNRLILLQSA